MKFTLIANEQQNDGFKLSVQAEGKDEMDMTERLTTALIEKITKIEVSIKNYEE